MSPSPVSVVLVGRPNTGKSALFNRIAHGRATVSNYPGTTVELLRAPLHGNSTVEVVDTPGLYSLHPLSEEEEVSRNLLLFSETPPAVVIHVVDAKNLPQALPLTFELREAGLPVVLAVSMMDEAHAEGIQVDAAALTLALGVPVFLVSALTGDGVAELQQGICSKAVATNTADTVPPVVPVDPEVEAAITRVRALLPMTPAQRILARLLLQGDRAAADRLGTLAAAATAQAELEVRSLTATSPVPMEIRLLRPLYDRAQEVARQAMHHARLGRTPFADRLSRWTMRPLTGLPILALVLYLGLYQFVGGFGAGFLVDLLETQLFDDRLNPWLVRLADIWVPWPVLRELFTGEYGMLTMGLKYAVAIIMPIVTIFFVVFAVIEDSGYLPRLALLLDRICKTMGMSGRAVIPMVLGLGCATMATMVTRTLPTRRERLLATLLLSLAVPCSAQLGVILGVLGNHGAALFLWMAFIALVFLAVGMLAAQLMPGEPPLFYMEVPPLRWPRPGNVLAKTWARVSWYFSEVLPLFLLASVLIWLGQITGVFALLVSGLKHPAAWLGLPEGMGAVFLFGFFRRDYGAAGLLDLSKAGALTTTQLLVACVAITLFLPCIAQFLMTVRERGWRTGLAISGFVLVFSFGAAWLVSRACAVVSL